MHRSKYIEKVLRRFLISDVFGSGIRWLLPLEKNGVELYAVTA